MSMGYLDFWVLFGKFCGNGIFGAWVGIGFVIASVGSLDGSHYLWHEKDDIATPSRYALDVTYATYGISYLAKEAP